VLLLVAAAGLKFSDHFSPEGGGAPNDFRQLGLPQESAGHWDNLLPSMIQTGSHPDLRWPDFSRYQTDLANFYESDKYALAWIKEGSITPQARALIDEFRQAESRGLDAEDYDGSRWADRVARLQSANPAPSDDDFARFDLAMTICLMRFISDLHIGRINPQILHSGFNIGPAKYDLAHFILHRIVNAEDVHSEMDAVEPPFPGYRLARQMLGVYLRLAREDSGEQLSVPPAAVRRGEAYAGVARLAELLRRLGDLAPDADIPEGTTIYTGTLEDAVKRFQKRHGLDADGRLGKATLEQLNTPLSRRVEQLRLALERWRWIPHEFAHPPVIVNIPEFQLRALDAAGNVALTMRVVVGKAYHNQTPVFANEMKYIIFRPYWNVPSSIQMREVVPQVRKDPDYLERNNFEVTDGRGEVVSEGAVSDEILKGLRSGELAVRQKPGPRNSLGLVKFMFPNEFDVYLHGTPARQLFSVSRRDFSHGCIRVEDPEKLAVWTLSEKPEWTQARIQAAMQGTETVQVNLDAPIPVLVFYTTAVVSEDGTVKFLPDIYRYDVAMEQVLAKGYPYLG